LSLALVLSVLFAPRLASAIDPNRPVSDAVRRNWGVTEGLPSVSVLAVTQTPDGYMWMGTQSGLVRFDGHAFTVFDAHNVPALAAGETIRGLSVAPDGSLWLATDGSGLLHYERGAFSQYTSRDGLSSDHVNAVAVDHRGVVWTGTSAGLDAVEGGRVVKPAAARELERRIVGRVFADVDGAVWVGMIGGGTVRIRGDRLERVGAEHGLPESQMSAAVRDRRGTLWYATRNIVFRLEGERFVEVFRSGSANENVDTLYVDRHDTVWVGLNRGGIRAIVGGKPRAEALPADVLTSWVTSIVEDHEGGLWMGGFTSGVSVLHDASFRVVNSAKGPLFVFSVLEARDGAIWVGGPERLLVRIKDGIETRFSEQEGLPAGDIWSLHDDGTGNIIVGYSAGASLWDGTRLRSLPQLEGLTGAHRVYSFAGRADDLWIGGRPGLLHWDGRSLRQFGTKDGLPSDLAASVFMARDGTVWVGTFDGPARMREGRFEEPAARDGRLRSNVFAFEEDASGTIWMATFSGLARYKNGLVTTFNPSSGLPVSLNRVIADRLGNLWLAASTGICMAPIRDLEAAADTDPGRPIAHLRCFDESHGLRSRETNCGGRSVIELRDGRLAFGTTEGLAIVDPANLVTNTAEPPVAIQQFEVDGTLQPAAGRAMVPAGARHIRFQYAALTYVAPKRVRYLYKLEGYDRDWVDGRDSRAAQYTNLPPGDYRFVVRADNGDGVWSQRGVSIDFHKQAHFYETAWFIVLASGIVIGSGAGAYGLRVRRLKATARLLESTVIERTRELRQAVGELEESHQALERTHKALENTHKALEEKDERLNSDLLQAKAFQQAMLSDIPRAEGVEFAAHYEAAEIVGGDIYDISEIEPGWFRIFLADTTGHGVQASLRTMVIKTEYDRLKKIARTPSALLSQLNRQLASNRSRTVGATACCIDLRIGDGRAKLTYSNAGHPEVFLLGERLHPLYVPGMYLGFVTDVNYADLECPIEPGHTLLVYSDGASELENSSGAMFGGERLADAAQAAVAGSNGMQSALARVNASLAAFRGDCLPGDDITLLMVKVAHH
jgi:serine phosphatase RsbU (regulator of sigma subunit)/ligand-binding sensor domain-containing protein